MLLKIYFRFQKNRFQTNWFLISLVNFMDYHQSNFGFSYVLQSPLPHIFSPLWQSSSVSQISLHHIPPFSLQLSSNNLCFCSIHVLFFRNRHLWQVGGHTVSLWQVPYPASFFPQSWHHLALIGQSSLNLHVHPGFGWLSAW